VEQEPVGLASEKLFYWLFQSRPDRILQLVDDLPADAGGYRFTAPVLKEREYRLDGLFLPPAHRPELPAVILEAQMASDPGFLRRLYAECARLIQQEPAIGRWWVVVLCPSRYLNFGDPEAVTEFLEQGCAGSSFSRPGCHGRPRLAASPGSAGGSGERSGSNGAPAHG
jgi:hypothetical protein